MNFLKLSLAFLFFFVIAFTGCDSSDPIPEYPDEDIVDEVDEQPDPDVIIPDPDVVTPDPDEQPDPDVSEPTDCVEDSDCGAGKICVPESAGSTYGTCVDGCSSNDECGSGSCNLNLRRCVNLTGDSGECSASNCSEGCCVAGDGLRSLTCAPVEDSRCSACGPCAQGTVCMVSTSTCVAAECSSADQCATLNSHITDVSEWECSEGICAMSGSSTPDADSGGACVSEMGSCTQNSDCCDGLTCQGMPPIMGFCMGATAVQ